MLTAPPPAIPAPHIEYWQLSPMLLVFAVAIVGVLVEAFAPRAQITEILKTARRAFDHADLGAGLQPPVRKLLQ